PAAATPPPTLRMVRRKSPRPVLWSKAEIIASRTSPSFSYVVDTGLFPSTAQGVAARDGNGTRFRVIVLSHPEHSPSELRERAWPETHSRSRFRKTPTVIREIHLIGSKASAGELVTSTVPSMKG